MKRTQEEFEKMVLHNSRNDGADFKVIGKYINTMTKIKMLYIPKNMEFEMTPNHFLCGRRPPFYPNNRGWQNKNGLHNTEWYKEKVKEAVGDEYTVVGEYTGYLNKILMRHNCEFCNNNEFLISPNMFLSRGHRCHKCVGYKYNTPEMDKKRLNKKFEGSGFIVEKVDLENNLVLVKHEKCNNTFYRKRLYFKSLSKNMLLCPCCDVKSKSNNIISNYLLEHNINFIPEYHPEDMERKLLRYDFKIMVNKSDFILLEADGIQHFERIEYFDSKDDFNRRKQRDTEKEEYAKSKNIPFYRISLNKLISKKEEEKILSSLKQILDRYKLL